MDAREHEATSPVSFTQKSFRRQAIFNARLAPDGRTILFSASTNGNDSEVYIVRPEYPEPSAIGLHNTHLLAVSSKNELAILNKSAMDLPPPDLPGNAGPSSPWGRRSTEILEKVREADWAPDGQQLAIIREAEGRTGLSSPLGRCCTRQTAT